MYNYKRERVKKVDNYNKIDCKINKNGYICDYIIEECEYMPNKYVDISSISYEQSTCRIDCTLDKIKFLKIYGYVRDDLGNSCKGVFLNLFNQKIVNNTVEYINRGEEITDSIGYFQFIVYKNYDKENYLVKISSGDRLG